jgi:hypothetical protein
VSNKVMKTALVMMSFALGLVLCVSAAGQAINTLVLLTQAKLEPSLMGNIGFLWPHVLFALVLLVVGCGLLAVAIES